MFKIKKLSILKSIPPVAKITAKDAFNKSKYNEEYESSRFKLKSISSICENCGESNSFLLRAHHIIPLSKGGDNTLSNLKMLCVKCHSKEHRHLFKKRNKK